MNEDQNKPESDNIENNPEANPSANNSDIEQTKPMPRRSRLSKANLRKSRNTLILSILGIAAILFLLFKYGIPLLSDASFLFGKVTSSPSDSDGESEEAEFVPVPNLDSIPRATNEKTVTVSGSTLSGLTVLIYLNGRMVEEIKSDGGGDFKTDLNLSEGENIIKAKVKKGEAESEFSSNLTVSYISEGPELSIDSPGDGSEVKGGNPIEVKGKSDPDTNILVNDFQAITNNIGEWSYFLTLKDGDNEIKVIATDAAGNRTEKVIHVNYSQ